MQELAPSNLIVIAEGTRGVGKSRLTTALHKRLGAEPHTRLRYFSSLHHQDSALCPFIASSNAPLVSRTTTRPVRG
jgi:hypothetical protein